MVPRPVSRESGLGRKRKQSGISPTTPRTPRGPDQRLPLILRNLCSRPIEACSEGSQGLSVLLRVGGIFTATTISPSWSWRQCPSHYAIHARRNLPDKELRYLRTVIVTAAVYRGFGRQLHSEELTAFLNLPAPGRRQSLYIHLRVSRDLCF